MTPCSYLFSIVFVFVMSVCASSQTENQKIFSKMFNNYEQEGDDVIKVAADLFKEEFTESVDDILILSIDKKVILDSQLFVFTRLTYEGNDCHACGPVLGIAVFKDVTPSEQINYQQVDKMGSWGELPPYELKVIENTKDLSIVATPGYTAQGYTSESTIIYRMVGKEFVKVFEMAESYLDNFGVCDEAEKNCFKKETEISMVGDVLIVKTTGNQYSFEKNIVQPVNKQITYLFSKGKYLENSKK